MNALMHNQLCMAFENTVKTLPCRSGHCAWPDPSAVGLTAFSYENEHDKIFMVSNLDATILDSS